MFLKLHFLPKAPSESPVPITTGAECRVSGVKRKRKEGSCFDTFQCRDFHWSRGGEEPCNKRDSPTLNPVHKEMTWTSHISVNSTLDEGYCLWTVDDYSSKLRTHSSSLLNWTALVHAVQFLVIYLTVACCTRKVPWGVHCGHAILQTKNTTAKQTFLLHQLWMTYLPMEKNIQIN